MPDHWENLPSIQGSFQEKNRSLDSETYGCFLVFDVANCLDNLFIYIYIYVLVIVVIIGSKIQIWVRSRYAFRNANQPDFCQELTKKDGEE